jgi:hypothetical protein
VCLIFHPQLQQGDDDGQSMDVVVESSHEETAPTAPEAASDLRIDVVAEEPADVTGETTPPPEGEGTEGGGRARYTPADLDTLREYFAGHIRRRQAPTFAEIRAMQAQNATMGRFSVQKLRDRVRNFFGRRR